ncbi:hypothetical protein CR513_12727, partial [Mucuna pruriens]
MAISRRHEMPQQPILFCEIFYVWEAIATKTNDAKVVVDFLKANIFCWFVTMGVTYAIETCPLYSTSMGWCTELPQYITPRQTTKLKCLIGKSRKLCKRWRIPAGRTGADSLGMRFGYTRQHTGLHWGCLPTELSSVKPATYKLNWNIVLAGKERKFQLQELEKLCLEAYENSQIYKQKVKKFHDSQILKKEFQVGQKVLLFNSRLKLIVGKLRSRWDGPFSITNVSPYGVVELKDETINNTFQRRKEYKREKKSSEQRLVVFEGIILTLSNSFPIAPLTPLVVKSSLHHPKSYLTPGHVSSLPWNRENNFHRLLECLDPEMNAKLRTSQPIKSILAQEKLSWPDHLLLGPDRLLSQ